MLMGSRIGWHIVWVIWISLSQLVQGMDNYNPVSLDDFAHDYAFKSIVKPRTGVVYNVSLPANFSGIEVSVVRYRSGSFWGRGANFGHFHIPPRSMPIPFVKRMDIVYQNLGNWSSLYYKVPNHTLVSPVVGFMIYPAMNSGAKGNGTLKFMVTGDPISIRFSQFSKPEARNVTMKCVTFWTNGSFVLSSMTMPNVCEVRDQGHFSVVIPSSSAPPSEKKVWSWRWWLAGIGVGVVGLVLVVLAVVLVCNLVRRKRIEKMERHSQKSEALETTWVGMSKMPCASGIRTQPVIENDYVP